MTSDLKIYRLQHSMTQKDLGEMLGVSEATISLAEAGRRALPPGAIQAFNRIRSYKTGDLPVIGELPEPDLQMLRDKHRKESDLYLHIHKKDREALLHKYEKQVAGWTKTYNKAMVDLYLAEQMIAAASADQTASIQFNGYQLERLEALDKLKRVSEQKPEIIMIKIEGLKQELRTLKTMLGKNRRYLGMEKEQTLLKTGNTAIEVKPGEQLLPIQGENS